MARRMCHCSYIGRNNPAERTLERVCDMMLATVTRTGIHTDDVFIAGLDDVTVTTFPGGRVTIDAPQDAMPTLVRVITDTLWERNRETHVAYNHI